MINYSKPIIAIGGPTASGKSSLAIKIAKEIGGYVINADSRQVYKELKIGTAQPQADKIDQDFWIIDGVKHYLYGYVSIMDDYNLFNYQQDVQKILNTEEATPILVGGTGLYIDSIIYNYDLKESPGLKNKRKDLDSLDLKELQDLIDKDNLDKLNNSDRNNPRRLIRIIERGGLNRNKGKSLNSLYLLLDLNTEELKSKIRQRTKYMLNHGLIKENEKFFDQKINYNLPAMQSIGYQEFIGYFKNKKDIKEVENEITLHTLQYAKRQRTWFRKNKDIVKVNNFNQAQEQVSNFLNIS